MTTSRAPSVFLVHSGDSEALVAEVLILSTALRGDGLDTNLDLYEVSPAMGWPQWLHHQIEGAHFVIVVCTEGLYALSQSGSPAIADMRAMKALWQWKYIENKLSAENTNGKFIPVIFRTSDLAYIPSILKTVTHYCIETKDGFGDLYRHLTSQPKYAKPPLGEVKKLPSMDTSIVFGGHAISSAVQLVGVDVVFQPLPQALPQRSFVEKPNKASLRKVLNLIFPQDEDINGFIEDNFNSGDSIDIRLHMTRAEKVSALLRCIQACHILKILRNYYSDELLRHEHVLQREDD